MKIRAYTVGGFVFLIFWTSISAFTNSHVTQTDDSGRELFIKYCGICHVRPEPADLTKQIWRDNVLPVMASRMGIRSSGYDPLMGLSEEEQKIVVKNYIIPQQPMLSDQEWKHLTEYIIDNAPDVMLPEEHRSNRNLPLENFIAQDVQLKKQKPSLITGLGFNKETKTLWIGDFYNKVYNWKFGKGITDTIATESPTVDFVFDNKTSYLTEIGKLYPTELSLGSFVKQANGDTRTLLSELHRPVSTAVEDLNNDGIAEIVVCNYGNKIGSLSLYRKNKAGSYTEEVLLQGSGAIKCEVKDLDGDGMKDIIAMFAQGNESVYVFSQKGDLKFKAKRVLRFPPHYGTTDMVLTDYNRDGYLDIITVHGDNADYSNILKPYHGIRIHLNNGRGSFKEKFFYPMYGVTRVLAEDFDNDGDTDLAATAFFPDFDKLVDESFVYLENINSDQFEFVSYTLQRDIPIKTLALIAADVDGDGDLDIVTGNFAQSPGKVPQQLDEQWKAADYGLTILMNQLYEPAKPIDLD